MKSEKSITDYLSDFNPGDGANPLSLKSGAPITIWLPADIKARYDKLQDMSGRKFSRKAREVLTALIHAAEAKAS
ncbi:MAG: hypothetical protein V4568_14605 [Pseudomonadota bacterium]